MRRTIALAVLGTVLACSAGCSWDPSTPLARAAARGDLREMESLLAQGADLEAADLRGLTPLIAAAREGQADAARLLLRRGADPNHTGGVNRWTPLEHAIHKGRNETGLILLDAGRARGNGLDAPLIMAAANGNAAMVRALLAHGADPGARDAGGFSALAGAVGGAWDIDYAFPGCEAHTETVRALLDANPALRLEDGKRDRAARRYAEKHRCVELLALVEGKGVHGAAENANAASR